MLEVSVTKGGDEVAEKDIAEKTLEGYNDVFAFQRKKTDKTR